MKEIVKEAVRKAELYAKNCFIPPYPSREEDIRMTVDFDYDDEIGVEIHICGFDIEYVRFGWDVIEGTDEEIVSKAQLAQKKILDEEAEREEARKRAEKAEREETRKRAEKAEHEAMEWKWSCNFTDTHKKKFG